jgi:response regulator RpfG family c-di-GMP phosphodiesterase
MRSNPIIILEDDEDEQELLSEALKNINCSFPLKFFKDGESFLSYLKTTADAPFLIISAVNLYKLNGLEVKKQIQSDDFLRSKGIPFIFYTVKDDLRVINEAYNLTVQGYFIKGNTMSTVEKQLMLILDYWMQCKHPRN